MGTTRDDGSQQSMWVATTDLPRNAGHPFYERLNRILSAAGFDAFVEGLCARFYTTMGRPSLAPGRYFRLLLLGSSVSGSWRENPRKGVQVRRACADT